MKASISPSSALRSELVRTALVGVGAAAFVAVLFASRTDGDPEWREIQTPDGTRCITYGSDAIDCSWAVQP